MGSRAPLGVLAAVWCAASAAAAVAAVGDRPAGPPIRFDREVRPILSEHCFQCHGPDPGTRQGGLRLDRREDLFAIRPTGAPVTPGRPDRSRIWVRISAAEPARRMPPPHFGKALTPRQKEIIRRWIEQGAPWSLHWAYAPVRRPPLPRVRDARWPITPVDRFILARLEREGLKPSPVADRRTLLRRLSLDLVGLPPTPEEVDAFLADRKPGAYERQVERLLASPHYGERMAQHWLDLVRYADTVGYHGDQDVTVWPYRDWVIRAFNANMPFDRFTREQLAGDLLPNPTREQRVASGYNRLGMMSAEGGVQDREYRAKYAAERVRNAAGVWLGQTLGCAECHDHKYDPLTQRDFYRFAAFFADLKEQGFYDGGYARGDWGPFLRLPSPDQERELARLDAEIAAARRALAEVPEERLAAGRAAWETAMRARLASRAPVWRVVVPLRAAASAGSPLAVQPDGIVTVSGDPPPFETYEVTLPAPLERIAAVRLEALPDGALPGNGIARAGYTFVLSEFELLASRNGEPPRPLRLAEVAVNTESEGYPGTALIDGRPDTGWSQVHGGGGLRAAAFRLAEPLAGGENVRLFVRLRHETAPRLQIGRFRLALSDVAGAQLDPEGLPEAVLAALRRESEQRSPAERAALDRHYRAVAPELAELRARLARLEGERSVLLGRIPRTLVAETTEPRVVRVLPRGNWMDESGEIVQPGVPEIFPQLRRPGRATRLDLANWLVSRENPLTARVFVNRLWKLFFGTGLSRTLDDFGAQGEPPVHPELLDWLADEFMRSGWDVKQMVRLLVTSATYRQSSRATPELQARDPYNRLYARQSALRLEAEFVRDNALAIAGLLNRRIGGPSVKPYQPRGYLAALNFPRREWATDTGEALYRRGLYVHWQRTFLHPALLAFDAPTREECTAQRVVSNTPMQALVLLNDPVFVEAARAFAERIVREGGANAEARVAYAVERALARPPRPEERALLLRLYERQRARSAAAPAAAERLFAIGEHPRPAGLDPVELAAWTAVARAILNLHETITRE